MSPIPDTKREALRRRGVFYNRHHAVTDVLFHTREFFDPCDLVQVKYEMLRRVEAEEHAVATAAAAFGFSRTGFYQAQAAYRRRGLPGLIPQRPGPRRAHKLSGEVMELVLRQQAQDTTLRASGLAARVHETFGLSIHPRSIERALARGRKKGGRTGRKTPKAPGSEAPSRGRPATKTSASRSSRQETLPAW
jgi:transposase